MIVEISRQSRSSLRLLHFTKYISIFDFYTFDSSHKLQITKNKTKHGFSHLPFLVSMQKSQTKTICMAIPLEVSEKIRFFVI